MTLFTKITTKAQGAFFELKAAKYLKSHAIRIIETNWYSSQGEIDIIGEENGKLIFFEVRYRKSSQYGNAASTVNKSKQKKLISTANSYMKKQGINLQHTHYRFDIIAYDGVNPTPSWLKNAF